ncbi:sigma-70 family RNA polymerase sigma factor [Pseudomaricurvus sp.]|uniref:sigma-70 family RNA polymerase sigma factor n=1 Tax=Pseudomaricurvus sp. TaxID=2004510 RepID=UPI003F6BFCE9
MVQHKSKTLEIDQLQVLIGQIATVRDREAFSRLFEHYAPLLKSYSLAKEPGAYLVADELVQEVLIKVWNKAHLYDATKANPNTWIFTLARNCRIDYLRRNGRYANEVTSEEIFDQIEDTQSGPFEQTQQRKTAQQIHSGLKTLPNEQSQVLRKVYLEGKTQQEAAAELSLPLGTVKSRIRLALQKLEILIRGHEK